jgi:hypothetical protein
MRNGVGVPSNKPSNVLNEDLGGIQLVGSSSERSDMLRHLNELTDHTLVMSNITPELSIVYVSRYANNISLPSGNRLILELLNSKNYTTFITYNYNEINDIINVNNANIMRIDPHSEIKLLVENPRTGDVRRDKDNTPIKIIMAHELIHAHRIMQGTHISLDQTYNYRYQAFRLGGILPMREREVNVPKEELATIGLRFVEDGDITENMIRDEHGLLRRGAYYR